MKEISISEFRATCSAVLERVRKTRQPARVTRFGEPFVDILPPSLKKRSPIKLGSLRGTARILGDIVGPTWDEW